MSEIPHLLAISVVAGSLKSYCIFVKLAGEDCNLTRNTLTSIESERLINILVVFTIIQHYAYAERGNCEIGCYLK